MKQWPHFEPGYETVLDADGFRSNVGIIICNRRGKLLWTKRIGQNAWQFPQGGMQRGESFEEALYRELLEEVGLSAADVGILERTRGWLRYRLPQQLVRRDSAPPCIGQKQKWFLLGFDGDDSRIQLSRFAQPEFDDWRWIDYWEPVERVVRFKREVYRRALTELRGARDEYVNACANNNASAGLAGFADKLRGDGKARSSPMARADRR